MRAKFPSPLYAYVFPTVPYAVFLRTGESVFLPLFTSNENAMLYAKRAHLRCAVMELRSIAEVVSFVEMPPAPPHVVSHDFEIAVDPISPGRGRDFFVFKREHLIESLRRSVGE